MKTTDDELDRTFIGFAIGHRRGIEDRRPGARAGWLGIAAQNWKAIEGQEGVIAFVVEGYDDDPRELWDIPEVCLFVRDWVEMTSAFDDDRILQDARRFLLVLCGKACVNEQKETLQ